MSFSNDGVILMSVRSLLASPLWRSVCLTIAAVAMAGVWGCASPENMLVDTREGPWVKNPPAEKETAYLELRRDGFFSDQTLHVTSLNGHRAADYRYIAGEGKTGRVPIPQGTQLLYVRYNAHGTYSYGELPVQFFATAGRTYQLRGWPPMVFDAASAAIKVPQPPVPDRK